MFKRLGFAALLALAFAGTIELGGQLAMNGEVGFVSRAEAIVGRPLTPVSYAGVARRTAMRCAAYC
jgi:hypothetical protein